MGEESSEQMKTLLELFPDLFPHRLLRALEQHNGDLQAAIDHILASSQEQTGYQLSRIYDMFPDLDEDVVRRHFEECAGDTERTTDALLGYQVAKTLQDQLTLDDQKQRSKHLNETKLQWSSLDEKIQSVVQYSGLSVDEARTYFHKNGGNVCESLVDIVFHHKEKLDKIQMEQSRTNKALVSATPKFLGSGRVQSSYTAVKEVPAYSLTLKEKAQLEKIRKMKSHKNKKNDNNRRRQNSGNSPKMMSRTSTASSSSDGSMSTAITVPDDNDNDNDNDKEHSYDEESDDEEEEDETDESEEEEDEDDAVYCFHESNSEVQELANIVYNDKSLVDLSWNFYKNAMMLFKGKTEKVINLAIFLLENDAASMTYKDINKALDYSQLFANLNTSGTKPLSYASAINNSNNNNNNTGFTQVHKKKSHTLPIGPEADTEVGLDRPQIILQRKGMKTAVERNVLDLHNFHVANAKATTAKALMKWWSDELQAREVDGRNVPSSKAYMIPPLTIITGRGIHSDGGKSKIRHSLKAMLENGPYKFTEEASSFTVVGRKIGR